MLSCSPLPPDPRVRRQGFRSAEIGEHQWLRVYYFVDAGYDNGEALGELGVFFDVLGLEVRDGHCRALEELR